MARENISLADSVATVMSKMAEGNIGALTVAMKLLKEDPFGQGMLTLLHLDDMNIRGTQLWIAFKECCGEDLQRLVEAARRRDRAVVDAINAFGPEVIGTNEKAVARGASFGRKAS